ncbi:MAG TPA: sodium:alanine symporter family protein, partial [Thermoanaerobaculia bacterium]|nr:sodium:alanine symporter family protein [Thermoanaerobaculia bacterium]
RSVLLYYPADPMDWFTTVVSTLEYYVWTFGVPAAGETIPIIVIALLGTGVFLTLRLAFIQVRRLGHGFAVTSGRYDDPSEPGDVPHFQALTTALSATVGIGNIAGVAIAIHFGGPGALFWMWVTAFLGMAVKYSEVTLAQHFRQVEFADQDPHAWEGSVSGGPMYYIERGLGPKWKPMAIFFAGALMVTSFLTGNAVQANTVADTMLDEFGIPVWLTGLVTAAIVAAVILGGIRRIGRVTAVLAPVMAVIYVTGALVILGIFYDQVLPAFALIFREAFQPTAGVAGTGVGVFLTTMMWGVRRGLFSNEAGQGSAPIAHAAAKTDEPVSEGAVALLEPFIDTLVICTLTGLVVVATGVYQERIPTAIGLLGGDLSYVEQTPDGAWRGAAPPEAIAVEQGHPRGGPVIAWHEVAVDRFFTDRQQTEPFHGTIYPGRFAEDVAGERYRTLYGMAVESGAPLTKLAFQKGLPGTAGRFIVVFSVLLFAISTAISWSYYGDRCANYLWGPKAILPYRVVFVGMHFVGAVTTLATVWAIGDIALGFVTFPNLVALVLLSGLVVKLTKSYFERRPWEENLRVHRQVVAERRRGSGRPGDSG